MLNKDNKRHFNFNDQGSKFDQNTIEKNRLTFKVQLNCDWMFIK